MADQHREAGASEAFGTKHPHLALWFGNASDRAHANRQLGYDNWFWVKFGRQVIGLAAVVVAGMALWRLVTWLATAVSSGLVLVMAIFLVILFAAYRFIRWFV